MTGVRFLLAFAALPLVGLVSWIFSGVRSLPLAGRLGVAAASGALLLSIEMFFFHLVGLRWSVAGLAAPLLVSSAVGVLAARPQAGPKPPRPERAGGRAFLLMALLALLLAAYAAATSRATSVDLLLFWGGKAARFAAQGQIDTAFLTDPRNRFMHPDYPPGFTLSTRGARSSRAGLRGERLFSRCPSF